MTIDLNPHHLDTVRAILAEHVPDCEVMAFGSRAAWTAHERSDLDLAVACGERAADGAITRLREAFEDSDLPIRVDVLDWHTIADSFRETIAPGCVVIQQAGALSGWRETTLGDVIEVNPLRSLTRGAEAPFVAMADVNEHQRSLPALATREFKGSGSRFRNGDTLLARITPCLENGKTAWVSRLGGQAGHGSTEFIVLSGMDGVSDSQFVYYLARSPEFRDYAIGQMTGTSGRLRVPTNAIESYEFVLPPLDEQHRIARVLGTLDERIEANQRASATLEDMARALFRHWFVDFGPVRAKAAGESSGLPPDLDALFPASFEATALGEVPAGWAAIPLGEAVTVLTGSTPSTKEPAWWGGDHWFVTPKDMSVLREPVLTGSSRRLTDAGVAQARSGILPPGAVLFSSGAPIGYLAITDTPVVAGQRVIAMVCDGAVGAPYALHWVEANLSAIESLATGTTFPEINKTMLEGMPSLLPPGTVHAAWDSFVAPLYVRMATLARQSCVLAAIRDTLLPRLVSGKVRTPDMPEAARRRASC